MAAATKLLPELFLDTLKEIHYAVKKILSMFRRRRTLPTPQTSRPLSRSTRAKPKAKLSVLIIGAPARGKKCDATEGIIDEGKEIMQEYKGSPALDAGLLAAAQAVEHYEISRYGALKYWSAKLGHKQAVSLLDQARQQEKKTDFDLTKIAETAVNAEAE